MVFLILEGLINSLDINDSSRLSDFLFIRSNNIIAFYFFCVEDSLGDFVRLMTLKYFVHFKQTV